MSADRGEKNDAATIRSKESVERSLAAGPLDHAASPDAWPSPPPRRSVPPGDGKLRKLS